MKKIISILLIFSILCVPVCAAEIDEQPIDSFMFGSVTYVPLARLCELLKLELVFEEGAAVIYANKNRLGLQLTVIDGAMSLPAVINDVGGIVREHDDILLPSPVRRVDGTLCVPLRAVCEAFGARVYWNETRGAYVERAKYNTPTLIRKNGDSRQVLSISEPFYEAAVRGDKIYYRAQSGVYVADLFGQNPKKLASGGKWLVTGERLFVLEEDDTLLTMALTDEEMNIISLSADQFMHLSNDRVLCVEGETTVVRDYAGELIYTLGEGSRHYLGTAEGKYFYIDKNQCIATAQSPDGAGETALTGTVYYAMLADGYIYYVSDGMSTRRISAADLSDTLVYGLALEHASTMGDKYLFNYHGEKAEDSNLFIAYPDGTGLVPLSDTPMVSEDEVFAEGGVFIHSFYDSTLYFVKDGTATKVTDDTVGALAGYHDGYIYYIVN